IAARFAKKKLGRALTNDQRARIAMTYTVASLVVAAPILWWWMPKELASKVDHLSGGGAALALGVAGVAVAAAALARCLLLSLFSPAARPRVPARSAGH